MPKAGSIVKQRVIPEMMQALLAITLKSGPRNCSIEPEDKQYFWGTNNKQACRNFVKKIKKNLTYIPSVITVKTPETSSPSWACYIRAKNNQRTGNPQQSSVSSATYQLREEKRKS